MNLSDYLPSLLESHIVTYYRELLITSPHDIDLQAFAEKATIMIHSIPKPSATFGMHHRYVIAIDNRLPRQLQRVQLAHELGHVLLHSGRQEWMPEDSRQRQEYQADRFAMYALMPTFMIASCSLWGNRQQIATQLAEEFDVPETFATARLGLLEQRLGDLQAQRQMEERIREATTGYDYSYRHPLNPNIEYLVKDGDIVGQRRRADL